MQDYEPGWYFTVGKGKKAHYWRNIAWGGALCGTTAQLSPCSDRDEAPQADRCKQCQNRLLRNIAV